MQGRTLWLMGSTQEERDALGQALVEVLGQKGQAAERITQADVKEHLAKGLKDTEEDRITLQERIGFLGHLLARNGIWAVITAPAPLPSVWERLVAEYGSFLAIGLDTEGFLPSPGFRLEEMGSPILAAQRLLAALEERGEVAFSDLPPEAEALLERRLRELGYVE